MGQTYWMHDTDANFCKRVGCTLEQYEERRAAWERSSERARWLTPVSDEEWGEFQRRVREEKQLQVGAQVEGCETQ